MSIIHPELCPPRTSEGPQAFQQVFAVASDIWTAVHNLGFVPNVGLYGTDGRAIGGHVESNSPTTTVVSFYNPVSGRMNLS